MKKAKWLFLLILVGSVVIGCKHSSNDEEEPVTEETFKAGDIALGKIKIGETEYEKTEQVYVSGPDGMIVADSDPSFIPAGAPDEFKGVFRTDRTVKLSPFIMSKYEVTKELYYAVMNGNPYGINPSPSNDNSEPDGTERDKYRPVQSMDWYDAVYFCNELTKKQWENQNRFIIFKI